MACIRLLIEREAPGGQAGRSSRIENYLGFPVGLSGSDLARRAVAQARRFGVEILAPQEVKGVRIEGSTRVLTLADGAEIGCRALLIATGIAFRKLDVPGLDKLNGAGVYYYAPMSEAFSYRDGDIYIVGGANSAGQAAMYFSKFARQVTMLVRGEFLVRYHVAIPGEPDRRHEEYRRAIQLQVSSPWKALTAAKPSPFRTTKRARQETVPASALLIYAGASSAHRLARRGGRAGCARLPDFRPAPDARGPAPDRMDGGSRSVLPGDQRAGHFRGRRCPPSLRQRASPPAWAKAPWR